MPASTADLVARAEAAVDALLADHAAAPGPDAEGYGNHVRRVFGLVLAQARGRLTEEELGLLAVAAVFHALGIWTDDTFDYLGPSVDRARRHLRGIGRDDWDARVTDLIERHHQLRPVRHDPLVEAFRRADLCDLTFGAVHRGIPAGTWSALHARFPIAGFHLRLVQLTAQQTRRDPRRPLPMLRW